MPARLVSVAILLYWVIAASSLIRRDVLPELSFVRPPDLGTIARAAGDSTPVRWAVEVLDKPAAPESRRPVGEAVTMSSRDSNGWVITVSRVWFDTGRLLKGTPLDNRAEARLEVHSHYRVDPSGNLQSFIATVRSPPESDELLQIQGHLKGEELEVVTKGPLPMFNQTRKLLYVPRSLVWNALGPFDRLPGLQVGQRWESDFVSPLTGRFEKVQVEVTERTTIHWDRAPVPVFMVVSRMAPVSVRTWVRQDGLVLRQEVPFPVVKLVLERQPDRPRAPSAEVPGR